ncbi:hypothetical protein PILCRDRAFT_822619 [Piloderma croceum F 1598]|uniref:Uncharacterized protein n=1 Tax=Piloderma croceum (strain F 1598) TaxID=765440 RepID=A0A0C3F688_PILCF|nr:hypothetical protein PILCRDRAFT_822619 [Piloderma croceum F 1598]
MGPEGKKLAVMRIFVLLAGVMGIADDRFRTIGIIIYGCFGPLSTGAHEVSEAVCQINISI